MDAHDPHRLPGCLLRQSALGLVRRVGETRFQQLHEAGKRHAGLIHEIVGQRPHLPEVRDRLLAVRGRRRQLQQRQPLEDQVQRVRQRAQRAVPLQGRERRVQRLQMRGLRMRVQTGRPAAAIIQRPQRDEVHDLPIRQRAHGRAQQTQQRDLVVRILDAAHEVDEVNHLLPLVEMSLPLRHVRQAVPAQGAQILPALRERPEQQRHIPRLDRTTPSVPLDQHVLPDDLMLQPPRDGFRFGFDAFLGAERSPLLIA